MLNTNQFTKFNATYRIDKSGIPTTVIGNIYSYESANKIYDVIKIPMAGVRYQINLRTVDEPNYFHNEIKKFYNIP